MLTSNEKQFLKHIKEFSLWDVHTWCDFDFIVKNKEGRRTCGPYLLNSDKITERPILYGGMKLWLLFFKGVIEKNYNLTSSEKITFYRGHQHSSQDIINIFFKNKCCKEHVENFSGIGIIFKFFPPCFTDNIYCEDMNFLKLKNQSFENNFDKKLLLGNQLLKNNFDKKLFIVICGEVFITAISIYFLKKYSNFYKGIVGGNILLLSFLLFLIKNERDNTTKKINNKLGELLLDNDNLTFIYDIIIHPQFSIR